MGADAALALAAAGHHASPLTLALAACAVAAGYLLLALARPVRACPKCKGQRVIHTGKRAARCPRCRGHGRVVRPGAGAVHRFYQSAISERRRARAARPERD